MKIKVGFDLSPAAYIGGVATYTKELAKRLELNEQLEMKFLYMSLKQKLPLRLNNVRNIPVPAKLYEPLMHKWRLVSVEQLIGAVDIYHSSDWVQAKSKAKKVTTYHDVIPLKYPQWSQKNIINVHRRRLELVEKEIDMVICVSETTKNDLLAVSRIDPKKIKVIYEGVDEKFKVVPEREIEQFREKMKLPQRFVLSVGGIGERRNLARIKSVCEKLEVKLIVSGVDVLVSDDDMPLLYNSAQALVYPSFYEGFGLPILEAFGCGIPVVTSDRGAMKEISGGAAILVDPDSADSITGGVKIGLDDRQRGKYIEKGQERAKEFSWDKCAKETAAIYEGLI